MITVTYDSNSNFASNKLTTRTRLRLTGTYSFELLFDSDYFCVETIFLFYYYISIFVMDASFQQAIFYTSKYWTGSFYIPYINFTAVSVLGPRALPARGKTSRK